MIDWKNIIIHHSATHDDDGLSCSSIRRYHTESRGWNDIGYHFIVERVNGHNEILIGRMLDLVGAHAKGRNVDSIGICCVGNYNEIQPPAAMMTRLAALCSYLCKRHDIPPEQIYPHNKFADTDCPGRLFDIEDLMYQVTCLILTNP